MKTINLICCAILLAGMGCSREGTVDPKIELTGHSECKSNLLKDGTDHPSSQDCIQYSWKSGDSLEITHVNAGFNCCPEGFQVQLAVSGDTLIISESENSALCDCNCLFDLNYTLTGIPRDSWWVRVIEPYVQDTESDKILFEIKLRKETDGEFCVTRSNYPWGM